MRNSREIGLQFRVLEWKKQKNDGENSWDCLENHLITKHTDDARTNFEDILVKKKAGFGFLREEVGLSEDQLCMVIKRNPLVLTFSVESSLRPKVEYFRSVGLKDKELAQFFAETPSTFGLSLEENIIPTMAWLMDSGPYTQEELLQMLRRFPPLLSYSVKDNLEFKITFFKGALEFSDEEFRKMTLKSPSVFGMCLTENIWPKVTFLQETFLHDEAAVRQMLVKTPEILFQNLKTKLEPRVEFFVDCLNMNRFELKKVILQCPSLLCLTNSNLIDTISFFENLGFDEGKLKKCLQKFPALFLYNTLSVAMKLQFLQAKLNLQRDEVGVLLTRCPQLLGLKLDERIDNLLLLMHEMIGVSEVEGVGIIKKMPKVLSHSLANLETKICAMLKYGKTEEVKYIIIKNPVVLTCSVEHRIIPRLHQLKNKNFSVTHLSCIIGLTDEKFQEYIKTHEGEKERLKSIYGTLPD